MYITQKESEFNPTRTKKRAATANSNQQQHWTFWTNKMTHELGHLQKDPSNFSNAPHITHCIHSGLLFSFDQGCSCRAFGEFPNLHSARFCKGQARPGSKMGYKIRGTTLFPFQAARVWGDGKEPGGLLCYAVGTSQSLITGFWFVCPGVLFSPLPIPSPLMRNCPF